MANIKIYRGKKGTAKKSATRGKTKVVDTFACGFCRPIVTGVINPGFLARGGWIVFNLSIQNTL